MKKFFVFIISYFTVSNAWAKSSTFVNVFDTPSFVIAVLAGLVIALGFQFLLTVLSIAIGITSVGNIKQNYAESKYGSLNDDKDDNSFSETGIKAVSGMGIWNLFTTAISLFGGASIALVLCPIDILSVKIALALCIWAAFYMIIFLLEYRIASGIIGGLVNTAMLGIKASGEAITSMFKSPEEKKIQDTLDHAIEKVRKEFDMTPYLDNMSQTLDKHFRDIKSKVPSYERIQKDIAEATKGNDGSVSPAKWIAVQGVLNKIIDDRSTDDTKRVKDNVTKLRGLVGDMQNAASEGGSSLERFERALRSSPVDNEKVDALIAKIEGLMSSGNATSLQKQIEDILDNPQNSLQDIQASIKAFDKTKIKSLLYKNTSLPKDDINRYVDRIFDIIRQANERLGITNDDILTPNLLQSIENKVRNFIDTTDNDELNYALLKNDIYKIWNNPKDSLEVIKHRLDTFDRDTLVSLVTNNSYIDRVDYDRVIEQFESAKKDVKVQIDKIESTAQQKISILERKAVVHAENTRKLAATAAWWVVATVLVSGIAAIGGGILSI